jgi:choloylglycine hydrolase
MNRLGTSCILILLLCCTNTFLWACTDFRIKASDGTVIIARSMEFALDLRSNLRSSNRGRTFNTPAPNGQAGLSWKAKYGYVFLDGLNVDMAIDGVNEKGLSFEALYLPGLAQYQPVPAGQNDKALPYLNFGDWVLSNFDSVDQVRSALPTIFVFTNKLPGMGDMVFPLHFSIFDASGKGIIVEYVHGKLNIHDNKIGVLTNSPSYNWHITNMNNYVHLLPVNPNPIKTTNGLTFAATGQGFGMIGLPGDISPPSRFVKIATLLRVVMPSNNAEAALNLAEHVINNVDIPLGLAREPEKGNYTDELTQWIVFKDLTNKVFYYRTYVDPSLRKVALKQINFAENAPRLKMPIASKEFILDVTEQFLKNTLN